MGLFFWNGMCARYYITVLFIGFILPFLAVASDNNVVVSDIIVSGNKTTEESVITREMHHKIGDHFKPELLSYERDRIYSLGLFNRVEIHHAINENRATIFIDVHERWYIFPVPVFGIKDRDWSKLYYGFGLVHYNFRGRNEKLWGGFALGYDPWISTLYSNPAIFGRDDLYFETQFIFTKTENRSVIYEDTLRNFQETRYIFDITSGKRLSLFSTVTVTFGYRSIGASVFVPGHTKSPEGTDNFLIGALNYRYDTRDIIEYPMYGIFIRTSLSKSGFGESKVDHFRTLFDVRRYVPLSDRLSLAGRFYTTVAGGSRLPHYSHMFIGYEERIRGHFSEIYEGENLFLSSLEARFRLLGPKYYEWKGSIAPEFSMLRYGINLALFGDMGATWYREDTIRSLRPAKGFGGGIHLLLPYSGVLRLEYAFNESLKGEFIIDLFVMF
jgi:outer membrane protein assembly factor BamA